MRIQAGVLRLSIPGIVMNSDGELTEAFREYLAGKFGQITYPADHKS